MNRGPPSQAEGGEGGEGGEEAKAVTGRRGRPEHVQTTPQVHRGVAAELLMKPCPSEEPSSGPWPLMIRMRTVPRPNRIGCRIAHSCMTRTGRQRPCLHGADCCTARKWSSVQANPQLASATPPRTPVRAHRDGHVDVPSGSGPAPSASGCDAGTYRRCRGRRWGNGSSQKVCRVPQRPLRRHASMHHRSRGGAYQRCLQRGSASATALR